MDNLVLPDRTLTCTQNILDIAANYGYTTNFEEKADDSSPASKLIALVEQIEKTSDSLNQIIFLVKRSEFKELNLNINQSETINSNYTRLVSSFKENLRFLYDNMDKIIESLDKPLRDESITIEMGLKYQKQASDYLRNAKMEISELATSLSLLKDLSNYVNPSYAMMNDDLLKNDVKFSCLTEKLKQCVDLLMDFYALSVKKSQETK